MYSVSACKKTKNKHASLKVMLVQNYTDPPTDPLYGVECRASSVKTDKLGLSPIVGPTHPIHVGLSESKVLF